MRKIPKGQQLDTCMCDGTERVICEFVKRSMKALCFDYPDNYDGSGSDEEYENDFLEPEEPEEAESRSSASAARCGLTLLALSLALLVLF